VYEFPSIYRLFRSTAPMSATVMEDLPAAFATPPSLHNAKGEVRKAGFELEYSGLDVQRSAILVRKVFGGDHVLRSTFHHEVHSPAGKFDIALDTTVLKERRHEESLRAVGIEPATVAGKRLEEAILGVAGILVPTEISGPPIPITDLAPLDTLRDLLRQAGAKGTRKSVFYAFGMHINPELPSDDPAEIRDVVRAFLLLDPWLRERTEVDFSRRIAPYINSFPGDYARVILQADYPASVGRLIDDYLAFNPTRNRPLDLLPVLAYLDEERVMSRVQDRHLVKGRPAYHYRLPNCMVDEPQWTLAGEWNTWVAVERLAADKPKLAEMSHAYLHSDARSMKPFYDRWPDVLAEIMQT
jgi:hypothetical protein